MIPATASKPEPVVVHGAIAQVRTCPGADCHGTLAPSWSARIADGTYHEIWRCDRSTDPHNAYLVWDAAGKKVVHKQAAPSEPWMPTLYTWVRERIQAWRRQRSRNGSGVVG